MTRAARFEQPTLAQINITPLVDVMLVLLVIFMIAAPVMAHRIEIDLPQVRNGPPPPKPDLIALSVTADGSYYWNGEAMPGAALAPQLKIEAHRKPQPELALDADRKVPYQRIATVLAAAREAGLTKIGFKTLDAPR